MKITHTEYARFMYKKHCTKNQMVLPGDMLKYYIFTVLQGNMESFLPESMVFLFGQITYQNGQAHFENLVFDYFGILGIKRLKNGR